MKSTYSRYLAFKKSIEAELQAKRPKTYLENVENSVSEFKRSSPNVRKVELESPSKINSLPHSESIALAVDNHDSEPCQGSQTLH